MIRLVETSDEAAIAALADRSRRRNAQVEPEARRIVDDVRRRGDAAVSRWSRALDGDLGELLVSDRELRAGWDATSTDVRRAIRLAVRQLRKVSAMQRARGFRVETTRGVTVEQRVEPLRRVGCYVPAGRYPLPSTLLMTAVPARVAGVPDVIVACARPAPAVLAAALEADVSAVHRVGGAQAVAAMAYGTASIPRVDKIVGPGNAWVAAAKRIVSVDTGVDLDAGPSEIVVWSTTGNPDWIAADLIAQAEHDPDARAIFVTTRRRLADQVRRAVAARLQLAGAGREPGVETARRALRQNGAVVHARSRRDAIAVIDRIAPEHLVVDSRRDAEVCRAGTVFVGPWSAQAAGDYCTGSNHVLPTGGGARARGGLSVADFQRVFSVQTATRAGIRAIAPAAAALADAEGLAAHAASIRLRLS